jgi:hypothetical protein
VRVGALRLPHPGRGRGVPGPRPQVSAGALFCWPPLWRPCAGCMAAEAKAPGRAIAAPPLHLLTPECAAPACPPSPTGRRPACARCAPTALTRCACCSTTPPPPTRPHSCWAWRWAPSPPPSASRWGRAVPNPFAGARKTWSGAAGGAEAGALKLLDAATGPDAGPPPHAPPASRRPRSPCWSICSPPFRALGSTLSPSAATRSRGATRRRRSSPTTRPRWGAGSGVTGGQ